VLELRLDAAARLRISQSKGVIERGSQTDSLLFDGGGARATDNRESPLEALSEHGEIAPDFFARVLTTPVPLVLVWSEKRSE
jgi:hypothetical protein